MYLLYFKTFTAQQTILFVNHDIIYVYIYIILLINVLAGGYQDTRHYLNQWCRTSCYRRPNFHMDKYGPVCQNQVSKAGTSDYMPQILWGVITFHVVVLIREVLMSRKYLSLSLPQSHNDLWDILPKGPYLTCVSMAGRVLLEGYPRFIVWFSLGLASNWSMKWSMNRCVL